MSETVHDIWIPIVTWRTVLGITRAARNGTRCTSAVVARNDFSCHRCNVRDDVMKYQKLSL
jgi:hypothetical protein